MESIATLTCCTGLFIPRIISVFTEQSQSGVEKCPEQVLERQVRADMKVLAKHSEKFKSSRRISSHWLIFRDHRKLRETECSRTWKISIRCHLWAKLNISEQRQNSTIRSRKEIILLGILMKMTDGKTHVNVQRIHSTQKTRGFKAKTHRLMPNKKLDQS